MITPQEYQKSQNCFKILGKKESKQIEVFDNEERKIEDKYYKLIRDLEEKRRKELNKIGKGETKFEEKIQKEKEPHYIKQSEFNRIIGFMEITEKKKDIDLNIEVYNYDYVKDKNGETDYSRDKERIFKKPISILKDNEFYKIAVYIYENQKPKNKFTLCLIGRSIFNTDKILNFIGGYLSDINENGHFKKVLKELPTLKELFVWWGKNQNKVFQYKINRIEEIIKEYKEVIKKTNSNVWTIAYLEKRKDYYENYYSHGTGTKEYFEVIHKLIKITKGKKREEYLKIIKEIIVDKI